MKKIITLLAIAAMAATIIISCAGNGSSKGSPFGSLPEKCAQFQQEKEKMSKEAESIKTEAEKAALMKKWNQMVEKWRPKIEESAKALDGKALTLAESDFDVTEPISFQFEKFIGDNELSNLMFNVNGSAKAATDITVNYFGTRESVYLVGYNAEGNEAYKIKIGSIDVENSGAGKGVIAAGTPVNFHSFNVNFSSQDYKDAQTLKLEIR